MRIVHLPFYGDNPYQALLMQAQRELGHEVWEGGGGGNFLGVALREWKADLIHFHWLHPYLLRGSASASIVRSLRFLIEIALLKLRGAKIAWTIHNLVNHDHKHVVIERWFSACFAKLCDRCYVHSQAAREGAQRLFGISEAMMTVIHHGNYIDFYPNKVSREEARRWLGLPTDGRIFLFLGRIEPYKGVLELIDAFASLPNDCHLIIAGKIVNSELLTVLSQRIGAANRIHLHARRIPDDQLQLFYNGADVVVFPFSNILTSGSLVLAMSFGKAIVAPRVASLEEIVPAQAVKWFDPQRPSSLGEAINAWQTGSLQEAGEQSINCARAWDWRMIAAETIIT